MRVLLVTGGLGFIGSNFIRYFLLRNRKYIVVNIDKLTYAGNMENLSDIDRSPRYHFIKGDICNHELVNYVMKRYNPNHIVNFAAESHVDRSIKSPGIFAHTNIMGSLTLLESARYFWRSGLSRRRFIQISTDEVYGSLEDDNDYFNEDSNLGPSSPYSASKAGADMMALAYYKTYRLPVIITRSCNNYGPYQNGEKFIPKCIINAMQNKKIPIYGNGKNIREWIHVLDHCRAVVKSIFYGSPGEVYNIGSGEECKNIEIAKKIIEIMHKSPSLIEFVKDRPGHDFRYALNSYKASGNLRWSSKYKLEDGLRQTIKWYADNRKLWEDEKE